MFKNKYFLVAGVIALVGVGGFWLWPRHKVVQQSKNRTAAPSAYDSNGQSLTPSDPSGISLTAAPTATGGLSVDANSPANKLGQLGPSSEGNGNAQANRSAAPKALDPKTFSEYEKYKDGNSALFGELEVGTGDELTANKKAAVYYKGWLTDGRLFDMSRTDKDGKLQPFVFTLGAHQVIPGWEQALGGMKVGGTRLIIVPPAVGYGSAGHDPIPPNAVLVFQVQLLAVQ